MRSSRLSSCTNTPSRSTIRRRARAVSSSSINTFLKLNSEARGYPDCVQTPEDEDRYIANFFASEGIRLDEEAIRPNAAKRGLAKLCLYSM